MNTTTLPPLPEPVMQLHNRILQRLRWIERGEEIYTAPFVADVRAALAQSAQAPAQPAQPPEVTEAMVSRFLGWSLPKDFTPDCGISFDGRKDDRWNKNKTWPVGTNLFTAAQARAMLEHVLVGAAQAPAQPDEVLAALDLDPDRFRTDGGTINRGRLRAAILHPHEYLPDGHWLRAAPAQPAPLMAPSPAAMNEWTEEDKARLDAVLNTHYPEPAQPAPSACDVCGGSGILAGSECGFCDGMNAERTVEESLGVAQPAPSVEEVIHHDLARKIASEVRASVGPSDSPGETQYVAAGWRAAVEALARGAK